MAWLFYATRAVPFYILNTKFSDTVYLENEDNSLKKFEINNFNGPQSGSINETNTPKLCSDEVLVDVKAASVNPLDLKIMAGYMESVFPIQFPYTPGTDFSGVVKSIGDNITKFKPGDRIVARMEPSKGGAFAQELVISADKLNTISDAMSFEQAAALPTAYGTAHLALIETAKLQSGQRVLIHAGAGGVGSFAIQIAKSVGAYVIATASANNIELLRDLGADEVIDYRIQDFTELTDIDVVLDTIGGDTLAGSWKVLSEVGIIATLADFAIENKGTKRGEFIFFSDATPTLPEAMRSFGESKLQIVMDTIFSLEETRAALEKVATGHARGKVTIRI